MEKEFLTYNQSLSVKQLGFYTPCFGVYKNGAIVITAHPKDHYYYEDSALTFHQARTFFEKSLGFYYEIYPDDQQDVTKAKEWFYIIKRKTITTSDKSYKSREEAESECIDRLIELANEDKA